MKLRTKLSLLFAAICAGILVAFAMVIYFSSENERRTAFVEQMQREALTTANLLLEANIDPEVLQAINRENRQTLSVFEVAIYDPDFRLLYHDAIDIDIVKETEEMIRQIISSGMIYFEQNGWEIVGLHRSIGGNEYVITVAGQDVQGYRNLKLLRNTIGLSLGLGFFIIFLMGIYISNRILKPVSDIAEGVKNITANNLNLRLPPRKTSDEVALLTNHFNAMLDRLEQSFLAQREFVNNISHEIRTPLAAAIAELELGLLSPDIDEIQRERLIRVMEDAKRIKKLSASLLDLARSNYDVDQIAFESLRIDELLMNCRAELLNEYSTAKVLLNINGAGEEGLELSLSGNEYLLRVAFCNIIENAIKFSEDQSCEILVSGDAEKLTMQFTDHGPGIDKSEISMIFQPFYRGKTSHEKLGSGIGLSLVKKIIELHYGNIEVSSNTGIGTEFKVTLPREIPER
ncbi:MAG: HAMP domain-containing protein [Saprospirales bacterium]|nr:MAG: HAMP domain-containing protein [Saprospirales bacterium]